MPNNTKSEEEKNASVAIAVSPADSAVWLNDQQTLISDGKASLNNLKPGTYTLTVRHTGYYDVVRQIDLRANENDPINITLGPLKSTLSVKPNIDGSSIRVRNVDRDMSAGEYAGAIDQIEYPPGEYEITISKPGYQPANRRITLKAGGTLELEPRLDPLPTPTPTAPILITQRSSVTFDGKYLIVRTIGTSGNSGQTNGTLNVTVNRGAQTAYVEGSLNGFPCKVSLVSGENVAEGSLIDIPSLSNAWSLVGTRIRPKDPKRPASFTVNWSTVQVTTEPNHESQGKAAPITDVTTKAVPIHRVVPTVPLMARSSRTKGLVKVSVEVDEEGNVKSAKAFDGPLMLRQAAEDAARSWKFKPATRNGVSVRSTEVIYFTFEGY